MRVGDTVVLEGVPAFLATGGEPVQGSRATVEGKTRLSATDSGGRAKGEIQAHYHADGRRVREQVRIRCQRTDGARSPYSVVAIASDATETELFTGLRPRNRGGEFHATLDTRGGYEIPGGGLVGLSEQTIEVRDKDGAVVLTGTFPDVTVD